MKIQKAELKHFKFHKNLIIDFDAKNLLIYGENGVGKSSIYEALYSNFYHQKRLDKDIATNIQETYRSRGCEAETLEVNITFDGNKVLNRSADVLSDFNVLRIEKPSSGGIFNFIEPTIYFANEKVLNRLTKENFYIALNETLFEHFPQMKSSYTGSNENYHFKRYAQFNNLGTLKNKIIDKIGNDDVDEIRAEFENIIKSENELLEFVFNEFFPTDEINNIIKKFDETFKISFVITPAQSGYSEVLEFNPPIIKIKIDDVECDGKLSHHFNEAKLKLIGVAIYFALAKKYEASGNGFKLLVLDDFLTSLDMANRKLISKVILDEFSNYQKIILTHNLQFYNLIKTLIKRENKENSWDYKYLFLTQETDGNKANIKDKNSNYLKEARRYKDEGEYHISGNFLRKEFEVIAEELRQILELGETESLNKIIELIKNEYDKDYFIEPLTFINCFKEKFLHLTNKFNEKNEYPSAQLGICKSKFSEMNQMFLSQNKKDEISALIEIIKKIEFYKDIFFNKASHREKDIEVYKKECERGISLLNDLQNMLKKIKGKSEE